MPKNEQPKPGDAGAEAVVNATEAAKELAKQTGVDLGSVTPTGETGNITKPDVEEAVAREQEKQAANEAAQAAALEESGAADEARLYEAKLNPDLPGTFPDRIRIGDRYYSNGTPITQEEADSLKQFKSGPSVEHPGGVQYVLRGKEITA